MEPAPSKPEPIKEIHILWITAGLSCDGDTISVTAATQPSLEEVLIGGIPGLHEVRLHDPLYVANEGKLVAIVAAEMAEPLVARMRQQRYGAEACVIGEVKAEPGGIVSMRTGFGGTRIVDMLVGEQLPRIC